MGLTHWQATVERTVTALGYELVDSERSAGGMLRVFIDHPAPDRAPGGHPAQAVAETFITVDDCEKVTRQLQHVLEVDNVDYTRLEVSSPGLDRPLKKPADYARFAGHEVDLTLRVPFQGRKKYRGVLAAQGDGWRLVLTNDKPGAEVEQALDFKLDEVRDARLVPVLDFKGRRFAPVQAADNPAPVDEVDGGLDR